jgi:uncharacterized repeat protein (TIGR01451 family)/MYXO-CTERM domain-containing protein
MKKNAILGTLVLGLLGSKSALADTYDAGTLIIPMDTSYQDSGMLKAYGLVYELLRNGVPVEWAIRKGKSYGGVDFTASATPYPSGTAIASHGYRGGPWLVSEPNAAAAYPIINAWKSQHTTTVHVASASFDADVARRLVVAPTIAMFADGNQKIARDYLQAAGIPDSTLNYAWPDSSPDMLDPNEVAGPTTSNHADGKLFDSDGDPSYCQFMSMHWGVAEARAKPEVVAEVRSFLRHPTHFFAECQAVNAYENDTTNGLFLTTNGFLIASKPSAVDFYNADYPFAQIDGPFKTTGGSEPAYSLPSGDSYKSNDIVMLTTKGTAIGIGDVWMTGYLDGACDISDDGEGQAEACLEIGKVSYLGGHEYATDVPISTHPQSQGTRLFLNSLFEAPCATQEGQPDVYLEKDAPSTTTSAQVTYTLYYENSGPTSAGSALLRDTLPAGTSFVSATGGGVFANGTVSWNLGNLGNDEFGSVSVTVTLGSHGSYDNEASLEYRVGLNTRSVGSNTTTTIFDDDSDGDGIVDSVDICPDDYNPLQNLSRDIQSCGSCGNVCSVADGVPRCSSGVCSISSCDAGHTDCDRLYANGCEFDNADFPTDEANCGACQRVCAPQRATGVCEAGFCTVGSCNSGYADCNNFVADGCEYATSGFANDRNHCGDCDTQCGANELCQAGSCVPSPCPQGSADCQAPAGDCETSITNDVANCGGCGIVCDPPHASGVCTLGSCAVSSCDAGYSDCNGLAGDGCEYDTTSFQSDLANCGACGNVCAPANGRGACTAGACSVSDCDVGYSDCNGLAADGCEYEAENFADDVANCGGCGNACAPANAAGRCASGECSIEACNSGYADFDGAPENGCEAACTATGSAETLCNGVDDDCDGLADEDYLATSCGVGACTAASICFLGEESCTPAAGGVEGPAGAPTCSDGADNDCDGLTDDSDAADCPAEPGSGEGGAAGATEPGAGGSNDGSGGSTSAAGGASGADGSSGDAGQDGESGASGEDGEAGEGNGGSSMSGAGTAGRGAGTAGNSAGAAGSSAGTTQGAGASPDSGDDGGCGCRTVPRRESSSGTLAALLLLAMAGVRRRRR